MKIQVTKKIFTGIMSISVAAVILTILLVAGYMHKYYSELAQTELENSGDLIAAAVEETGIAYLLSTDISGFRVTLIEPDGSVSYDSDEDASLLENHSDRIEVKEAMEKGSGSSSRYSSTHMTTTINYAKKLSDGSVIRVSDDHVSYLAHLASMLDTILLILLAAAALAVIAAVMVSRHIVRPINNIDLDHPNIRKSYKELAPLLSKLRAQNGRVNRQIRDLRRSQEQFVIITESMNEGLVIADQKSTMLACNSAAWKLLGSPEPASNASIYSLERSDTFRRCIQNAMGGKRSECIISTSCGDRQVMASPAKSVDMVNGIVVIIMDVTEKQELEVMRREFTSNVSHELKTPLTTIYGISDMLANGMVKQEDVQSFGANIRSEADRLITLINDIVSLSKLDEDSIPHRDVDIDLYELSEEIITRLKSNADEKHITASLSGEHIVFRGNNTVIDEIIYNLCDNAIKYNKTGGSYSVDISKSHKKAVIKVSDTGIGIPEAHIDRIFERFYRVDKSRSRRIKGTGLGLSIVKHGVMYHNGTVRAESTEGSGTVFIVEFPLKTI